MASTALTRDAVSPVASVGRAGDAAVRWAARKLRDQAMPGDEITAVLTSADSRLVHRYLELHAERLEERFAVQRRTLREIERVVADSRPRV